MSELMMGDLIRCLPTRLFILGLRKLQTYVLQALIYFRLCVKRQVGGGPGGRTEKSGPGAHPPTRRLAELPC